MSGLSVVHHLLFKELQMILIVAVDLEKPNGYLAVPPPLVYLPPAALRYKIRKKVFRKNKYFSNFITRGVSHLSDKFSEIQLLKRNVPLLQVDAGLTGLAGDGALPLVPPRAGQVVQLVALAVRNPFHSDFLSVVLILSLLLISLVFVLVLLLRLRVFLFSLIIFLRLLESRNNNVVFVKHILNFHSDYLYLLLLLSFDYD